VKVDTHTSSEAQQPHSRQAKTFCRLCSGRCGLLLSLADDDSIVDIRGDHDHPLTQGYACIKGLKAAEIHNAPQRLLQPLEKQPDGSFKPLALELALDRIAHRLSEIVSNHGPDALGLYRGTQHYTNTSAFHMLSAFSKAIGTRSNFSTMTIDQSAKWVTDQRLGVWAAGRNSFASADVWLFIGYNPLVSVQSINGFPALNPTKQLKAAKQRGMTCLVIDPRRTETARFADVHLQPLPGEDVSIVAGMLNLILQNDWHDAPFCEAYVDGLEDLRLAVADFTHSYVARRAGIDEEDFCALTRQFAQAKRGIAVTGTGIDMSPHSNLAEHLVEVLNVICGRFNRAGEAVSNPGAMSSARPVRAEVIAPARRWESSQRSRVRNLGRLFGEKMSGVLAEEILNPGEGQLRAMIVDGGNPVNALPNRELAQRAFSSLDLLVSIDPFMSDTAQLADYILPPTMMFERADMPMLFEKTAFPQPFAQYSEAIVKPSIGSDVCEDAYVFWALAKRLKLQLNFAGEALAMDLPPSQESLLEILMRGAQVPLAEIKTHSSGKVFELPEQIIQPPSERREHHRFCLAPDDVLQELAALRNTAEDSGSRRAGQRFPLRLAVRRSRSVINSSFRDIDAITHRMPYNPLWMNPDDAKELNLSDGAMVSLASAHGRLRASLKCDDSMRPGVVAISHGWGGQQGSSVNDLVSGSAAESEAINGMPWFSAIPVAVSPCDDTGE